MTTQLLWFWYIFFCCKQQKKNTENGAAVISLRSFLFCDNFITCEVCKCLSKVLFQSDSNNSSGKSSLSRFMKPCKARYILLGIHQFHLQLTHSGVQLTTSKAHLSSMQLRSCHFAVCIIDAPSTTCLQANLKNNPNYYKGLGWSVRWKIVNLIRNPYWVDWV